MLVDIANYKRIAEADLSGWDSRTAAGAVLQKREAEDQLKQLTAAYKTLIANSVVKVFVTGEGAEAFASVAKDEGAVVVDGARLYKELAVGVEPTLGSDRSFGNAQLPVLIRVLQQFMTRNNVRSVAQPKLPTLDQDVPAKTTADVVDMCRKAVRNTNGDDLLIVDLQEQVLAACIKAESADTIVPVILTGLTPEETQSCEKTLFGSQPSVSIEATSDDTAKDLIKDINEKIRAVFSKKQ